MNQWSIRLGQLAYWGLWPLLFIQLFFSRRSRIFVVADGQVLVVKGWLSAGQWELPGGGIKKREQPAAAAARELAEETGVKVKPSELELMSSERASSHGFRFTQLTFLLALSEQQPLQRQKWEIAETAWLPWQQLYQDPRTAKPVKRFIQAWYRP